MAMDFSGGAGAGSPMDLIPNGQLAWVIITYRDQKVGAGKGTVYHDLELTLDAEQPFKGRKLWHNLMDPSAEANSATVKQMGLADITRILEAGRWALNPNFDQGLFASQGGYTINAFPEIDGLRVAVKIKVEKGTEGYADKNVVAEFLSPNPASSGHKGWKDLIAGKYNSTAAAAGPPAQGTFGGFGAGATAQPAQTAPAFGNTAAGATTSAPVFGNAALAQPAAGGTAAPANPTLATGQPAAPTPAPAGTPAAASVTSPSNQPAAAPAPTSPNSWLAQANS